MIGYPKNLNTREDYDYVRANFPKEQWVACYQGLLDTMRDWFFVRHIEDGEAVTLTENQRVEEPQEQSEEKRCALYEYRVNEHCKLLRLGFTEAEVRAIVEG